MGQGLVHGPHYSHLESQKAHEEGCGGNNGDARVLPSLGPAQKNGVSGCWMGGENTHNTMHNIICTQTYTHNAHITHTQRTQDKAQHFTVLSMFQWFIFVIVVSCVFHGVLVLKADAQSARRQKLDVQSTEFGLWKNSQVKQFESEVCAHTQYAHTVRRVRPAQGLPCRCETPTTSHGRAGAHGVHLESSTVYPAGIGGAANCTSLATDFGRDISESRVHLYLFPCSPYFLQGLCPKIHLYYTKTSLKSASQFDASSSHSLGLMF